MITKPSVSIIVPAYNEELLLQSVILELYFFCKSSLITFEIIIIDDCSTDQTNSIGLQLVGIHPEIRLIRNDRNLGCHPSVRIGFDSAVMEWMVFLPGDGQIPPSIISQAFSLLPSTDLVCTDRHQRSDKLHRILISNTYNIILRLVTGLKIQDFDSAILIRRDMYSKIRDCIRSHSASISVELAVYTTISGGRVGEIKIAHRPRRAGVERGLNWRDIRGVPSNLFRMALLLAPYRIKNILKKY
jgi:glycosyltransferase involved in cell wall biosynthesis